MYEVAVFDMKMRSHSGLTTGYGSEQGKTYIILASAQENLSSGFPTR